MSMEAPTFTARSEDEGTVRPLVSVVVPARNSEDDLVLLLERLERQTVPRGVFEVLIVDDCSTDRTAAVAEASPIARLLRAPSQRGSYAARNVAVREAAADLFAFTDADCLPAEDWIESGLAAMRDGSTDMIAGQIVVPVGERPSPAALLDATRFFDQQRYAEDGFGATANLWVRRRVFAELGLFNDKLISGGDTEFGLRVTAQGATIRYEPNVRIEHPPRWRARDLARKSFRLGYGAAQHLYYAAGPLKDRAHVCTRPGAYLPKGELRRLERLEDQGYTPTTATLASMWAVQYACVKLPNTIGNLIGTIHVSREARRAGIAKPTPESEAAARAESSLERA